jgi:hypothetical protein
VSNRYVVMLAALISATCALGQAQAQPATYAAAPGTCPGACEAPLSSLFNNLYQMGRGDLSAEANYVLWFLAGSKGRFPISTSLPGLPPLGELGDAERQGVLGSGGRFALGYWQIEDSPWVPQGIRDRGGEARFFFVGRRSADLTTDTPTTLFRPFFDLNNRTESGFLIAAPGIGTGSINAHAQVDVWGAEANLWKNVFFDKPGTSFIIDLMAGFRYLNANSALDIASISTFNPTIPAASPFAPFAGNQLLVTDSFSTRNNFYGGQVGIASKALLFDNMVSLEGSARIALGTTSEDVIISGSQFRTFANSTTAVSSGGVLALPSNIGSHHMNKFAQVPELEFKFAFPVGSHLRLLTGFSALYWTNIVRAAAQIDRSVDVTQIANNPLAAGATPTGLARPGVTFTQSDFWLLGINFGVEYKW